MLPIRILTVYSTLVLTLLHVSTLLFTLFDLTKYEKYGSLHK